MKDLIYKYLEKSIQSLIVYESMQERIKNSTRENPSRLKTYQVISDNCIQMAAVNWCHVFASKKNHAHYAIDKSVGKKQFLSFVETRNVSFQVTCDKMRSFRDKYSEGEYPLKEVAELFEQAINVIDAYEHAMGERGLVEMYNNASRQL